jgi:hypothetical protein
MRGDSPRILYSTAQRITGIPLEECAPRYVDPSVTRNEIAALRERGMTLAQITRVAGISRHVGDPRYAQITFRCALRIHELYCQVIA